MKLVLLLLSAVIIFSSHAADDCLSLRSGSITGKNTPSTCIPLERLDTYSSQRSTDRQVVGWLSAVASYTPIIGPLVSQYVSQSDNLNLPRYEAARNQFRAVLNEYVRNVQNDPSIFNPNSGNVESHFNLLNSAIQHSEELDKILKLKNLTPEERDSVLKLKQTILQIGLRTHARLLANYLKADKKEKEAIISRLNKMEEKYSDIQVNNIAREIEPLSKIRAKIDLINQELKDLERDPAGNKERIAQLKQNRKMLQADADVAAQEAIQNIRDYSQFAQGMTAIYSMFNPAEAAKLNNAITGITNMSVAYLTIAKLGAEGATSAAAFGAYGMMAMGAVQLMNSFGSNNSSNDAFKAIFAQLKFISKQITDLRENMNERFDGIQNDILVVEKNILSKLAEINSNIHDLAQMMDYSVSSLNEIQSSINELSQFIVSESIKENLRRTYLSTVDRCLGQDVVSKKLSKKELTSCLDDFNRFLTKDASSSLLTRKTFSTQYRLRNQFEWKINNLTEYIKLKAQSDIDTNLANPELVKDLWDNVRILKEQNKNKFNDELHEHPIFGNLENTGKRYSKLVSVLNDNPKIIKDLKIEYKNKLIETHERLLSIKAKHDSKVIGIHSQNMEAFKETLRDELIKRGNSETSTDAILTINIIKDYLQSASKVNYNRDPLELIDDDKIVVFANSCAENGKLKSLIPVSLKYLKDNLGDELAKRFILNPEKNKLCFIANLQNNNYVYAYTIFTHRSGLIQYRNMPKPGDIEVEVGGGTCTMNWAMCHARVKGKYKGEFLKSFTLIAEMNQKRLMIHTFNMNERIPLRNGESDRFALLTLLKGKSYSKRYDNFFKHREIRNIGEINVIYKDPKTDINVSASESLEKEMLTKDGKLLGGNFSANTEAQNLLKHEKEKNQLALYELEKKSHEQEIFQDISKYVADYLKTEKLDAVGEMLSSAVFYKSGVNAAATLETNLSEVWGLRSGEYLKKFYLEVLSTDASSASFEYILEDQLKHLEAIK